MDEINLTEAEREALRYLYHEPCMIPVCLFGREVVDSIALKGLTYWCIGRTSLTPAGRAVVERLGAE